MAIKKPVEIIKKNPESQTRECKMDGRTHLFPGSVSCFSLSGF